MKTGWLLALCIAYTYLRYSAFGAVDVAQWPAFLLNKALSLYAVSLLCLSAWHYRQGDVLASKQVGRVVWHVVILHIGFSLALLSPEYYEKFYSNARLNLNGEIIIACGVFATYCFWLIPKLIRRLNFQHRIKLLAVTLVLGHLIPMGSSWLSPASWHGFMPPISLVSACACLFTVIVFGPQQTAQNPKQVRD